jgi:hypothetical protein
MLESFSFFTPRQSHGEALDAAGRENLTAW